jgi:hypothetical protein
MDKGRNETPKVLKNGIKEVYDSSSTHRQMRAENLVGRIIEGGVKDVKPNVVFHGIDKSSMSFVPCSGNVTEIWRIVDEGIKETIAVKDYFDEFDVNKVIEGGVKYIEYGDWSNEFDANKVIEGGVKCIEYGDWLDGDERINNIINDGIKL